MQTELAPDDLWSEDGDIVWIRADRYENIGKAKYAAYTGRGLPVGLCESGEPLTSLHGKIGYMRPSNQDDPEVGWCDEMWYICDKDHSQAVRYYKIWV